MARATEAPHISPRPFSRSSLNPFTFFRQHFANVL
ncbi:hypothetical protein ALC56_01102 [Trachymyrmex septentrionalis]|uniref:Uncharacterized protein n=1 Tax=Trachymyrmex septentrionalis TaxID=34720 RepID=A0A195FX29_9HYME|nr:hypothetical protein ALC56_01102 [Trachymyrmex septentrionalis]